MESTKQKQLSTARALIGQHQYDAAGAVLAALLLSSPADFEATMLVAQLHIEVRDFDRAFLSASAAVNVRPDDPYARYLLGRVHKARGELEQAEACYRRAVAADPNNPNILTSLGVLMRARGKPDEAIALYRHALAIQADHPEARNNLANILAAGGSDPELMEHRGRAQGVLLAELNRMRAAVDRLLQQKKPRDAFSLLKASLRIAPTAADMWLRAGELSLQLGTPAEALDYLDEAYRLNPRTQEAIALAFRVCVMGGLRERALRYAETAYRLAPSEEVMIASKVLLPAINPSREALLLARRDYEAGLEEILAGSFRPSDSYYFTQVNGFFLAYHNECNRSLQTKAAQMYLKLIPDLATGATHCALPTRRPGRIRIAFISKFLWSHSIGKTTRGLVEKLDRDRFEVYVLQVSPSIEDLVTDQIFNAADHVIKLNTDVRRAREQIASLGLDILFYQDIGLEPVSYFLAFARLALVQCVSFGHPDTTGIPNMDYFISNDLFEIPQAAGHYSEQLFLLHDLPTLAYYYKPGRQRQLGREIFGLPAAATVYLCPQTLFKIHPDFDPLIRDILSRDDAGVAVFIEGAYPQWTETLRQRLARSAPKLGDRVIFLAAMENDVYLELLAAANVILDPIYFNGMNSSLEAFAVGTPVVTFPTDLQRGRHTQAMYRKMEISACIAKDERDYVDIAVRLGTDRAYAREISERILDRNLVLFEDIRVVREFERFFIESLQKWL